jgi:hypothetical protein
MPRPEEKTLLQAVNTLMRLDSDRCAGRLDEIKLHQIVEAEQLLGGLAGGHVVQAFLQWQRSGLGRGA